MTPTLVKPAVIAIVHAELLITRSNVIDRPTISVLCGQMRLGQEHSTGTDSVYWRQEIGHRRSFKR